MTVRGPIEPKDLGFTSMHEHILSNVEVFRDRLQRLGLLPARVPLPAEDKLSLQNRSTLRHAMILSTDNLSLDDENVMTAEVADFKAAGGSTILEVSAPGIRTTPSDALALRRISERTGVHVVASTGLYAEDSWPDRFRSMTLGGYTDFLRDEIAHGIGETGVLPGHIKVAYEGKSEAMDTYLRAAARVSRESGLSMQVHVGLFRPNDEVRATVLRTLYESECIPNRTLICHVENWLGSLSTTQLVMNPHSIPCDLTLHKEVLDRGFALCFTCIGAEWDQEPLGLSHRPDWFILAGLRALLREGYAEQLVLGHDVFTKLCTRRGGGEGFTRIPSFVIPTLRDCGVPEGDLRKLTVDNPARLLAF
jgi:phosphotriesterase-related protein